MVKVIYGGSVNAKNIKEICLDPEMDGVLIGRETLLPHELIKIIKILSS
jgi:triosephosphate isomerase